MMYADRVTDSMKRAIDETERQAGDPGGLQQGARHNTSGHTQGRQGYHRKGERGGGDTRARGHRRRPSQSTTS